MWCLNCIPPFAFSGQLCQDAPRMSLQRSPGAGRLAEAAHRVGVASRAGSESLG